MTFGEKLTGLRKREGLSQEALAEQLGVSRQAVSRWEQGAALPDAAKLLPCARLFSVDVEWLLDEEQGSGDKVDSRSVPASKNRDVAWIVGGSLLLGLALLGLTIVATIGTAFSVNVEAFTKNNELKSYSGLAGFLKYYDLYWVVAVLVLMAGVGVGMILWPGSAPLGRPEGVQKALPQVLQVVFLVLCIHLWGWRDYYPFLWASILALGASTLWMIWILQQDKRRARRCRLWGITLAYWGVQVLTVLLTEGFRLELVSLAAALDLCLLYLLWISPRFLDRNFIKRIR